MAKKDKRRPGGVAGLRELTECEKQQVEMSQTFFPCGKDRLSELTETEKQQAEECLEEMTKIVERQPGENDVFSDRNEPQTRQDLEKDLNHGKTEKLISRGQDTSSSSSSLKGYTIMEDSKLEEMLTLQQVLADMSEFEKQQAKEDLEELQGKMNRIISKANDTAKSLRQAADFLDKVWKDCKIARASGSSAGIVGGALTITGGILTILTMGVATPLLVAGIAVGVAGTGTQFGASVAEARINSKEIKKADKDLRETCDCISDMHNTLQLWLDRKEKAKLLYMLCLAVETLELSAPVIKLLRQILTQATGIPTEIVQVALRLSEEVAQCCTEAAGQAGAQAAGQADAQGAGPAGAQTAGQAGAQAGRAGAQGAGDAAESGANAGANAGSRLAGGLIIGFSAVFPIWDAIDLGLTIRDIVQNKGSKAASYLRETADELEKYTESKESTIACKI